ncbi:MULTISPECIES: SIR2 family protein [unclassified Bradyrhizobium]|uniref:SIR2 family protein n=1 Tax=unclassified Bradyrhizobium TaxID=2631580 RepID=UPI001FFBFDCF|nr:MULTISPECIES: SIR2 family protein [unclassified Bradyrhizobium]
MNGEQQSHDAQKTLTDLRDHLARHDKPIAFFFGAGTSCSVRVPTGDGAPAQPLIPAVPGLTAACKKDGADLGEKYAKAWALMEAQCVEAKQDPHVENILSRLRMMLNAIGKDDTLSGLKTDELEKLEESVRKTIARLVTPDLKGLPTDFPHRKLARWLAKTSRKACVEIFTVNYDVLIEHGLESERVPVFDGFVGSYQPFFLADSLRRAETAPGPHWTRLWKMHGSVTWRRIEQDGRMRVVRGDPDLAGEMILPSSQKYDESRQQPYAAFVDRLTRFLEQDDALLIVAGFSFGDEHINNLIFGALENRPRTHVYALQFEELSEDSVLIKRAYQRSNLIVVGPKTGVIGGRRANWYPSDTPAFMDGVFELQETPTAAGVPETSKTGLMKIGDFARFCNFLDSMAG